MKYIKHFIQRMINKAGYELHKKNQHTVIEAYNFKITDEALLFWELCAFLSDKGFRPIDLVDLMHRKYDNSLWQMDLVFIRSTWNDFAHIKFD